MRDESNPHRSPRYEIVVPVSFEVKRTSATKAGSGWTRSLSERGACLELTESLAPGTAVSLLLRINGETFPLQAEVVWVDHPSLPSGGTLHGVAIHRSTQDDRQGLQSLLRHAMGVPSRKNRIPVALLVQCHPVGAPGTPLCGWTGDLSQEGCSLILPDRLPMGTLLEVTLTLPRSDVTAEATVVWVEPPARRKLTRHGVYFTKPNLARDLISGLVSSPLI